MSSAQRRAREKANLQRAILDAARELFVTEGYEAVNMRAIANKIEYSATTIYLYFKDKDEILFHLVEEGFAMLNARLETLESMADPVERLRQGGSIYLEFAQEQPHYYKIMFQLGDRMVAKEYVSQEEQGQRTFRFILACIAEGVAQGQFALAQEERIVAHAIWAHIHGAASLALAGRLRTVPAEARQEFYAAVIETTLRGLSAP